MATKMDNKIYHKIPPKLMKKQWSGTDKIESHILTQTQYGKETQTNKTA